MKKLIILFIINFNLMYTQNNNNHYYKTISFEEFLKYDLKNMKDYEYSAYNQSTALFIDENRILIFPNLHKGRCLITSKEVCDEMFTNNTFPILPENDTPYFRYKNWMNKDGFIKENMLKILNELNFKYQKDTFYADAEKFVKKLSSEDRKIFLIPVLYFIGEDLMQLSSTAEWSFTPRYYFQPFNEPILYYEEHFYSFYDLNILLEEKLLNGKNITFQKIYKRVEGYYLKKKKIWDLH